MKICKTCGIKKENTAFDKNGAIRRGVEFRRTTCRACRLEAARANIGKGKSLPEETQRFARKLESKRYLITAAQNATPVHEGFFAALKTAAEFLDAELVVVPLRYRNPTSQWSQKQETDEWWAEELQPYLFNQRKKLNPNLVLVGDVKTVPTASQPLNGFESLTGTESCIFGHTKMQMKSVPVPTGRYPKILTTTGACTIKNYTDSKAGKLGAFHHFLGAIIVEIEGKKFHLRQINASREDGSFIDLDVKYSATGVEKAPPALGLVMGDTHARFTSPEVDAATFGPGGIVETLNPETLVFHDVIDGYANNPHHVGNPFNALAKRDSGFGDVRAEVEHVVEFLKERTKGRNAVIVSSNHDNFLSRWVIREDWRRDPENAKFYLETALAMVRSVKMGPGGTEFDDPFRHWMAVLGCPARTLSGNESFKLADIECGMHGDRGPNGARGTVQNLSRLGTRNITGHGHSLEIDEGHYRVGTSTRLRLEYNSGPSSWTNTHCVVYANGKRALISVIDGAWRLEK